MAQGSIGNWNFRVNVAIDKYIIIFLILINNTFQPRTLQSRISQENLLI